MPIDPDRPSVWTSVLPKFEDIRKLYEQADVNLAFNKFMIVVVALAALGGAVAVLTGLPYVVVPVGAAAMGMAPFFGWSGGRRSGCRRSSPRCRKPSN